MSCRVLKRGVEQFLLNHLVEFARSRGLRALRGEYIPTAKNGLVRDHYANLGFTRLDRDDSGRTTLGIARGRRAGNRYTTFITESHPHGPDPR